MDQGKLLNRAQAEAVYSAMCALNNVGATIGSVHLPIAEPGYTLTVNSHPITQTVSVTVWAGVISRRIATDRYASQHEFAKAYGLVGVPA